MTSKERLIKSLTDLVLAKIETPIHVCNHLDEVDLTNEVSDILSDYKFNKQQVLDITDLMFDNYASNLSLYNTDLDMSNDFGQCYHDFIIYYVSEYVAKYLLEQVD